MWLLFQSAVMMAVGCTGIYYEWTPNRVALGIIMVGAAWWATRMVSAFLSWCRGTELARADRVTVLCTACILAALVVLRQHTLGLP